MSLSIQSEKFTRKEKVKEDFRFKNQKTEVQTRESRVYAPFSRKVYKGRKRQNAGLERSSKVKAEEDPTKWNRYYFSIEFPQVST